MSQFSCDSPQQSLHGNSCTTGCILLFISSASGCPWDVIVHSFDDKLNNLLGVGGTNSILLIFEKRACAGMIASTSPHRSSSGSRVLKQTGHPRSHCGRKTPTARCSISGTVKGWFRGRWIVRGFVFAPVPSRSRNALHRYRCGTFSSGAALARYRSPGLTVFP
jgi:hypothetical protein